MNKLLGVFVLSLAVFAVLAHETPCCEKGQECKEIVCQPCRDAKVCPECFENGKPVDHRVPCCQQYSQVIALTAASVSAATQAFAAAEATSYAATKVVVAASAGASVGAFVSICQSVSMSVNTGKCCEVSADIGANASSYAQSFAAAAAEADSYAAAAASAASASAAASAAASSLFAQAESLIKSSCCGFDLEVYSAVMAAGNYAVSAQTAANAAAGVSTSAKATAKVAVSAASESIARSSSLSRAKQDNCCKSSFVSNIANATASVCLRVCQRAKDLHGQTAKAFDFIAAYARESNAIETPVRLVDSICAKECKDVKIACCRNNDCGCKRNDADCCLASKTIAEVYLAANATTVTTAQAAAYAKSQVKTFAAAYATAFTAAYAATATAVSVKIQVRNCCSMVVEVDTAALANAKSVGAAISAAKAAAEAHSYGYSYSDAVAKAVAKAAAAAEAAAIAYYDDCCGKSCCQENKYYGKKSFSCCGIRKNIAKSFSHDYVKLVSKAVASVATKSQSVSRAATSARASDCTNVIRRVTTRSAFLLQCCCCNTKNVVASTRRGGSFSVHGH